MVKEKFIKTTIILMIGGLITKILGMIIKIIMNRLVGIEGIGLYMLIFPTFSLFMSMSQLSLPVSISKLVSEEKHNNKKLIASSIPIILITNTSLMGLIFLIAPILSNTFLHDPRTYLPILAISLVLPFEALSNLLRGYFFGKQKMLPHVISHVIEQIVRLSLIVLVIPNLVNQSIVYAVCFLILVNMISEFSSIIILMPFLPKNTVIRKSDLKPNRKGLKNILNISIPTTGSRLIGNIGYFLEPIILTFVLTTVGYSNNYILNEYGIISGYVMPLLLLPSFFTNAISQALIPVISKSYSNNMYKDTKRKLKQGILFSLAIGIPNTTEGIEYIRFLAPVFLLHYLETPLASSLQAMGKAKETFNISLKTTIIRSISLFILLFLKIGMWGFIFSLTISIIYSTYMHLKYINKSLKI